MKKNFITDALTGILDNDYDEKEVLAERMKRYETEQEKKDSEEKA